MELLSGYSSKTTRREVEAAADIAFQGYKALVVSLSRLIAMCPEGEEGGLRKRPGNCLVGMGLGARRREGEPGEGEGGGVLDIHV